MLRKIIPRWPTPLAIAVLSAIYFFAGKFGLSLAFVNASASAVWPPTGIALAALLLWGYQLWPGIFLGAFLVNITTQGTLATTFGIAVGNTLEALLGAWLVCRFANGVKAFQQAKNILKFILLAAVFSTSVSATFGVTSLCLGGFATWQRFWPIWATWFLGDMVGDLIVAPLLVISLTQTLRRPKSLQVFEGAALLLTVILVGEIVFLGKTPFDDGNAPLGYLALLPLLWAALRFGHLGAVTGGFLTSVIALWGSLHGLGPFVRTDPNESLLFLQAFIGTITVTALVVASVVAERKKTAQRLQVQDALSRVLAEAPTLAEGAPRIIQGLCEMAGWELGAMWSVDRGANELSCVAVWHIPYLEFPEFEATTRQRRFASGIGLPGRVWQSGQPAWVPDVTRDLNFPRAPLAAKEGLHAAFGFPLKLGDEILAVIECFSREVREPDDHFLQMLPAIGAQLGQFIERRGADEARRHSEALKGAMLESALDCVISIDQEGNVIEFNPAAEKTFGYARADILGKRLAECIIPPRLREDHYRGLAHYLASGEGPVLGRRVEMPALRADGTEFPAELSINAVQVGGHRIFTAYLRDITRRKQAYDALRESKERFQAILDNSTAVIYLKDLDGRYILINHRYEELFRISNQEISGKTDFDIFPEHMAQKFRHNDLKVIETGAPCEFEEVAPHWDGTHTYISIKVPLRDADGKVYGVAGISTDISERKRSEVALEQVRQELIKSNQELERMVRQRDADLEQAKTTLLSDIEAQNKLEEQLRQAQKLDSIGTLAGGVAHDFNNILNIIKGYAGLLAAERPNDHELGKSLNVIDETVDRGASIVQQLLAIARRSETRFERIDVNELIAKIQNLLRGTFPKTIEIVSRLEPDLPPITADPNQIDQVVLNICLNARDAMTEGGRLLLRTETVSGDDLRERFRDAQNEKYACVLVTDTGAGMDEAVKNRVFEPFFTTKEQGEGTGLGLSVAYGIVTNHGGFIDVTSQPNQGTTFFVYLPIADSKRRARHVQHPPSPKQSATEAVQGHTILFVEDEERQLELMRRYLESEGHRVLPARDGLQAVESHFKYKDEISAVVLDLGLPKLNGWEAFQKMREIDPTLKPIFATGYLSPEVESAMAKGELTALVLKPYLLEDMLEKISLAVHTKTGGGSDPVVR